jgi:hypothetical protein
MKELIDMWWNANSIIGKILKFVYDSQVGVSESELKEFIENAGSKSCGKMYYHLTTKQKEYSLIFERTSNNITKIKNEALDYIRTK